MLCTTFKKLSVDTWEQIELSKTAGYQLKEETVTDQNLLELKIKHPTEIFIRAFNKHEEGKNGADWEWWLTEGNKWVGFRIQAKIINIETNSFEHLHYQSKTSAPQSEKLILNSQPTSGIRRIPIYCMFLSYKDLISTTSYPNVKLYGCSLMCAYEVAKLRHGRTNDINSLQPFLAPWHKLVCKDVGTQFYSHIDRFLRENLQYEAGDLEMFITDDPPEYVRSIIESSSPSNENDYTYNGLAGVMVIDLSHTEQNKTE